MVDFNLIKNRINRFNKSSQISCCFQILDGIQQSNQKNYPLWNVLVLIKWILIHTNDSPFRKIAHVEDVVMTMDLIQKFEYENSPLDFKAKSSINRSLRIVAYQQFWYQDYISNSVFDRQILLYSILSHKYDINKSFYTLTGFTISDFLSLCYSVFLYFSLPQLDKGYIYTGFLEKDYFEVFTPKFGTDKLKKFLAVLTLKSLDELAALQKMSKEVYQLYETNFLSTKPFLLVSGQFKVPHKSVFNQTCKHFIYDFLKLKDPRFSEELGRRMEKYIQLGLEEAGVRFLNEKQLKTAFPKLTKLVDFFIDGNILIESKAIELHPNAAVLRYTQVMSSTLKDSIIKSYCQLLSVANDLDASGTFYGIVITYKETYIGFGADAWQEFLQDEVQIFVQQNGISLSALPPENLYFIDVETWDYLVQAIIDYKCSIQEVLNKAKADNLHATTKKLLLEQVLDEHFKVKNFSLSFLQNAHQSIDIL